MRNGFQYRVRTNAAVFALALAMVGGVSLVEHSALFALSPMAPLVIVGTIAFVFATLNGDRWALAILFVAAVLVFSVDLRPDLPKDEFVRPRDSDGLEMLKFAVFMLAFLGGAAALRALPIRGVRMPAVALALYLAWALMTAPISTNPVYTIGATVGLAAWILFAIALNERFETRELILLVVSVGGLFCAGSLVAYAFFPEYGQTLSYEDSRLTGLASVPNRSEEQP